MQPPANSPVRLIPELTELPRLVAYIEAFVDSNGILPTDSHAITLAAEELFANTIYHGRAAAGVASIEFNLALSGEIVTATYSDEGIPFDPTTPRVPAASIRSLPAEQRPLGGLGIHFIRSTMQDFEYARRDGRNVVTITRRLGTQRLAGPQKSNVL